MLGKVETCGVNTARRTVHSQAQMDSLLLLVGSIGLMKAIFNFDPMKQVGYFADGVPESRNSKKVVSTNTEKEGSYYRSATPQVVPVLVSLIYNTFL